KCGRRQPEGNVVGPQLGRRPDPPGPDDIEDLHEDEVDQPEFAAEPCTAGLDAADTIRRALGRIRRIVEAVGHGGPLCQPGGRGPTRVPRGRPASESYTTKLGRAASHL